MCYCVSLFKKTHYFIRNLFRCEILQSMEQRIIQVGTCKLYIDSVFLCAFLFSCRPRSKEKSRKSEVQKTGQPKATFHRVHPGSSCWNNIHERMMNVRKSFNDRVDQSWFLVFVHLIICVNI